MRVLVFSNLFHPDHAGGAAIYSDLCFELAARGHDVVVRCAYPYFPEWVDKSGRNGVRIERTVVNGVAVERFGIFIPRKPSTLKSRALYEASLLASMARSTPRAERADVIIAFSTMLAPVAAAVALGKLHRIPVIVNVQDVSSGGASAANLVGDRAGRLLAWAEGRILSNAAALSSISPEMVTGVKAMTGGRVPVSFVPNWLNASLAEAVAELPDKVGRTPSRVVRMLYAGNIGNKQGLLEFCQQVTRLDFDFRLLIHGSGPGADTLRSWHNTVGDERIELGPFLSESDFAKALYEADLFLITERQGSGAAYMPSKLIPAISSGTPILAVSDDVSSLGGEMHRVGIGAHITWDRIAQLPDVLDGARDAYEFESWQRNAIDRSHVYERTRIIDDIERELVSRSRHRRV